MKFITKNINRLKFAFKGISFALLHDFSYRTQMIGGAVVVTVFGYLYWPLTQLEILFLGLAWTLILITELQNTSFEEALDHMHPELHEKIGRSKDMAAGAVLTAGLFLIFVMVMIVLY